VLSSSWSRQAVLRRRAQDRRFTVIGQQGYRFARDALGRCTTRPKYAQRDPDGSGPQIMVMGK